MTFKTISKKAASKKKYKHALVLGGGGSHGFAHIGVLKELEKQNYVPDVIVGCSVGALIGVCYAAGKTIKEIEDFLLSRNLYLLLRPSMKRRALTTEKIVDTVLEFISKKSFSQLKISFIVNATNINTGEEVVFKSGGLRTALMATCTVPGVFAPVKYRHHLLIDGGFSSPLPIHLVKDARHIVAVDVFSQLKKLGDGAGIASVLQNAAIIPQRREVLKLIEHHAHKLTLISPAVGDFDFFDLSHRDIKKIAKVGSTATKILFK